MGTGGTWRTVFRKRVLIPCTGEDVFPEPQNIKVCDRGSTIASTQARASPEDYSS